MSRVIDLSQSSDDGAPANNDNLQTLEHAILLCPTNVLVETVLRLVRADNTIQRAFTKELVGIRKNQQQQQQQNKAPVAKWHTCGQCGEEYDATDDDQTCLYHNGKLEVDEECFPDHDEDCHGPMDTPENRRDFPDSFTWTCCDETTNAEGCCEGKHVPKQAKRRRVR